MSLLVANVVWPGETGDARPVLAARLGIPETDIEAFVLLKRSVDGRRRPPVWLANYRVELRRGEAELLVRPPHGVRPFSARDEERYAEELPASVAPALAAWPSRVRPIVIGAGPAGLFAALRLGEAGAPAILLERGGPVEERHHAVRRFWRHRELDPETNVVFGEGGAGAFSDGKIYTRRRDGDLGWIFRRLVDMGADPEILEEGWAHLGTDRIRELLPRLRARLGELGVEVRFHARVNGLIVEGDGAAVPRRAVGVRLEGGQELRGGPVIVAAGHSARDVWAWMLEAGAVAEMRPIHIGARIEHPQRLIDHGLYGAARADLPPASYRLTSHPRDARAAHTFCMCPGGTVVAATNHVARVVVNGMSYSGRRAFFANSAVIVEVRPEDYPGTDPLAGMRYQDTIEARAFSLAGQDYSAPAQRVADLLARRESVELPRTSYTLGVRPVDLREVLPAPIVEGMVAAIRHFDRQIPGFAGEEGVLVAPETRTTAPLRFSRGDDLCSPTVADLLPVGEGAGYAGGIVSAALDGYRAANTLIARFCPRRADA